MQKLLDDIFEIASHDKMERQRDYVEGKTYNIFDIVNLRTDEVRAHSAMLTSLLTPGGSHGCGDKFLRLFMKSVPALSDFHFNTARAEVKKELAIGKDGRIDIIITSGRKAIIIENKVYAGDQEDQIVRYIHYAKTNYTDYRVLYLTLDKHVASDYSAGNFIPDVDYHTISYDDEILQWLDSCYEACTSRPVVQNAIFQYSYLIKELTNQMYSDANEKEMLDLLCSKENAHKTAFILDHYYDIKEHLKDKCYLSKVKRWAGNNDYEYKGDIPDCVFGFRPKGWENHYIAMWLGRSNYDFGIVRTSGRKHKTMQLSMLPSGVNEGWPFGWERCSEIFNSIESIVNGEAIKYIKGKTKEILSELEERADELEGKGITL